MKKLSTVLLLISTIVYSTFGQSLGEHHIITSGSLPTGTGSIMVADINNDGNQDIVACSTFGRHIYFLENKGNQEFEVLQEIEFDLYELNEVKSGDLNNDGLVDIIYSRYDHLNQLGWLKNIGDNQFVDMGSLFSSTNGGWRTVSCSVQDLNGDNYDDLVIGCMDMDCELEVRINTGNGSFYPSFPIIDVGGLLSFQCIDIEGDNDIDIIYTSESPYRLVASVNNGEGEFNEEVIIDTDYQNPLYRFHSFDSDRDGDMDIVGFIIENDSIPLFLNNGENVFTKKILTKDSLFDTYNVKSIDFDNDGDLDLMNHYLDILENVGSNTFQFKNNNDFSYYLSDYKITELNNNGDEDIVYAYRGGSIGYIEDASFENSKNWRILTSQVLAPKYPAYEKINDDEFPDICVLDDYNKYVFYLNNGSGEFYDTIAMDRLHVYSHESSFNDINKDGFCDIVSYGDREYTGFNDSSNFKLARNNGDNTFTSFYINDFNHLEEHYAYFNDYNNDNILNAVLISYNSFYATDTLLVFNINPDFSISTYDTAVLSTPVKIQHLVFYDVDRNGQKDIIMNDENSIYVIYSINGHFTTHPVTITNSTDEIIDFAPANISNDTICDFLFITTESITVLENFDGTNIEQTYHLQHNVEQAQKLLSKDLDNDNIDEVFYIAIDKIALLKNISNNGYSIEEYYYNNYPYYSEKLTPFIFRDIDLDGDDDLLCTYRRESDLSWFENLYFVNSIEEVISNDVFTIYPNPAVDKLNFELKAKPSSNYEVILYDNLGKEVSHYLTDKNTTQLTIELQGFTPGIYFLVLNNGNRICSSKFIIM